MDGRRMTSRVLLPGGGHLPVRTNHMRTPDGWTIDGSAPQGWSIQASTTALGGAFRDAGINVDDYGWTSRPLYIN